MGHNRPLFVVTALTPFVFCVTAVLNALSLTNNGALYQSDITSIADKYYLEITPANWTFSIWGLIYIWQGLWIIYTVLNLVRKCDNAPLYTNPILMPTAFFVIYILNLTLNCSWLFVYDREIMEAAFALLFLMSVTLYISMILSYRTLDQRMDILVKQGRIRDVWLTRILVQNGLGIYATWCTIATLLNLGIILAYRSSGNIDQRDASTASLSALAAVIIAFLVTDWFLLDRYTRYTFTPYIVLIVGLTGSLAKNYDEGARNTIFTLTLLSVSGVAALVKCFLIAWRHCRGSQDGVSLTSDQCLTSVNKLT